jgi:hypothetical protein
MSELYFGSAPTFIAAFAQLKSHGLHEFPSEIAVQSVSTMQDWS